MIRFALATFLIFSVFCANSYAEAVSYKGMGKVTYTGMKPDAAARQEAVRRAQVNALEAYVTETSSAKVRLFDERREEIASKVEKFILASTVLNEETDKPSKTHTVVIRAEINAPLLNAELDAGSSSQAAASGERSMLTFLFVSRMQETSQAFDARVHKRTDEKIVVDAQGGYSEKTSEGEKIGAASISTSGSKDSKANAAIESSTTTTTGGSSLRKADQITWTVASASEINTSMVGVFSSAGFEVVEAEYVEAESGGQLSIERIRKEFSTGDDLGGEVLRSTVNGIRSAGIPLLAIGTLDVGMQDTDPASGNIRIPVTVTGKVLDVSGRFPRTVTSVGPVQFFGIGPDASVARTNALTLAATKAATQMVDELNIKNIK